MTDRERAFAGLIIESRQTRQLHKSHKRGIEAAACSIRERALLDAYRALMGKPWKDTANG